MTEIKNSSEQQWNTSNKTISLELHEFFRAPEIVGCTLIKKLKYYNAYL